MKSPLNSAQRMKTLRSRAVKKRKRKGKTPKNPFFSGILGESNIKYLKNRLRLVDDFFLVWYNERVNAFEKGEKYVLNGTFIGKSAYHGVRISHLCVCNNYRLWNDSGVFRNFAVIQAQKYVV